MPITGDQESHSHGVLSVVIFLKDLASLKVESLISIENIVESSSTHPTFHQISIGTLLKFFVGIVQ
jgi:hypothetical protein